MRLCVIVICSCMLIACSSTRPAPADKGAYVGTYTYESMDTSVDNATEHELDRLALNADGHYVLVQGGSQKARSETRGVWSLVPGEPPNIELDHHGYPIKVKRGEIRLMINDDLGEWYVKRK